MAWLLLSPQSVSISQLTALDSQTRLNQSQASWFASISINTINCPLGGILASVILDKLGRKFVIILINVLSIIAGQIDCTK